MKLKLQKITLKRLMALQSLILTSHLRLKSRVPKLGLRSNTRPNVELQLYRDGILFGDSVTLVDGETSHNGPN